MNRRRRKTLKSSSSPDGSPIGGCGAVEESSIGPRQRRGQEHEPGRPRAVAYVRESSEEQGQGFSPDAQREGIRRFAAENDFELIREYFELDSAWRKSDTRPRFQQLMADAAVHEFDIVLVYHTSRFARSQVVARRYKELLRQRLGIKVYFVTQPMGDDPTDPSVFLTESVHEMFDEYYSVSLSFWTRAGLREKARQGYIVGNQPWGYVRDSESGEVLWDPERAPIVIEMFERYATGLESDRTIAEWLNAKGARTARGRLFGADTVREMLVNTTYCGYVSGLRDKGREIRGRHEPIISEELFDRVQEIRRWRTRVVKPGRPSDEYLLRKLLYCERCGARMQGTRGSRAGVRRYQCGTRRRGGACTQTIVKAEPLEEQLVEWLRLFQPDEELRAAVLRAVESTARERSGDAPARRRDLLGRLERLQDLYVMGDVTKSQYVMRKQALEEELERLGPPVDPEISKAAALLENFASFWDAETAPVERRKVLAQLFDRVWQDGGMIVAVKPHTPFARYFQTITDIHTMDEEIPATPTGEAGCHSRERRDSNPRPPA